MCYIFHSFFCPQHCTVRAGEAMPPFHGAGGARLFFSVYWNANQFVHLVYREKVFSVLLCIRKKIFVYRKYSPVHIITESLVMPKAAEKMIKKRVLFLSRIFLYEYLGPMKHSPGPPTEVLI